MQLLDIIVLVILSNASLPKPKACSSKYFSNKKFTSEIFVDLIHLQDHIIGNTGLGQEDVQLAGHTAGNWVDPEPVRGGHKI